MLTRVCAIALLGAITLLGSGCATLHSWSDSAAEGVDTGWNATVSGAKTAATYVGKGVAFVGEYIRMGAAYTVGMFKKQPASPDEKRRAEATYKRQVAKTAERSGGQTTSGEVNASVGRVVNQGARETGAPNGGRVAIQVDGDNNGGDFVLIDPLTGQAEDSVYSVSADEVDQMHKTAGKSFTSIDGYAVLVADPDKGMPDKG